MRTAPFYGYVKLHSDFVSLAFISTLIYDQLFTG